MSIEMIRWVYDHSKTSSPTDRAVLLAIADNTHQDGSGAWPSVAEIVRKTCLSEATVRRSVGALQRLGEIEVVHRSGRSNLYRVLATPLRVSPHPPQSEPQNHPGTTQKTEGLRPSAARSSTEVATTDPPSTQVILGAYIDRCAVRPPGRVVGQLARLIKELLDEDQPPRAIWNGLLAWGAKGSPPSALPGFVNAAANQAAIRAHVPARSTTDDRAQSILDAGRRLQARLDAEAGVRT